MSQDFAPPFANLAPPAVPTAFEVKPTVIMSLWCCAYAITIIIFRCTGRWMRTERIWVEDVIIGLSVPVIIARTALIVYVLHYGTNNVAESDLTGDADIRRREIGSKLVLCTRILYATFLWMTKLSVTIYVVKLTDQFWAAKSLTSKSKGGRAFKAFLSRNLNRIFYGLLCISYSGVVVSHLTECHIFNHYWQVVPTVPVACRVSYANLFNTGVWHMITDLALVALPLPMVFSARLPARVKAETMVLMLFPLIDVAFTSYRLPTIALDGGAQTHRTLMASIDILITTASSNSLVVISFLQDRGFKKLKYTHHETEDGPIEQLQGHELKSIDRPIPTAILGSGKTRGGPVSPLSQRPTWGSDEDLMLDDSEEGPSSLRTTSVSDADPRSRDTMSTGVAQPSSTDHLSPAQKGETIIVASRRVEFADGGMVSPSRSQPSRTSSHQAQGIMVETTWKVQIS